MSISLNKLFGNSCCGRFALIALTASWIAAPHALAEIAPTTDDAYVRSDRPSQGLGGLRSLQVDERKERSAFLQFDTSALSGIVQSATLTLRVNRVRRAGDMLVQGAT